MAKKLQTSAWQEQMLRLLSEFEPLNYRDYAELAGITLAGAHDRMKKAHNARLIHVARCDRNHSGIALPFFAIGNAPDAAQPPALTDSQRTKDYIARIKVRDGGRKWKEMVARKTDRTRERKKTDPEFVLHLRYKAREWSRQKYGHKPRIPSIVKLLGYRPRKWKQRIVLSPRQAPTDPLHAALSGGGSRPETANAP